MPTRKNDIWFKGVFTATDGSGVQPTSAKTTVSYMTFGNVNAVDVVNMTLDADGQTWRGKWSSANALPGIVEWHMECFGPLRGSRDGQFELTANTANMQSGG